MDCGFLLNVVLLVLVVFRIAWWNLRPWWKALPPSSDVRSHFSRDAEAGVPSDDIHLAKAALQRCNASVLTALAGDAAAAGTHHRYLHGGFEAEDRLLSGPAFRDLASAASVLPEKSADGRGAWKGAAESVGHGTTYGHHLLMVLSLLVPQDGPGSFDFASFQRAWHAWQLQVPPEHRGKAAEIALKNLERGLTYRDAATLVGDIGATPRIPGLVAAFVREGGRQLLRVHSGSSQQLLETIEDDLALAAQEITMVTHDRPEAIVVAEFLSRIAFRLAFREVLLQPTPLWIQHGLDRPTAPSLLWRAVKAVQKKLAVPFLRQAVADAESLCALQQRRAPLGGELGWASRLERQNDREDLGGHHTRRLPTPQSDSNQRELFGLSGGLSAALPAVLYLAWKYEQHPSAALSANVLLGGNSAGRGLMLGMLLGMRSSRQPPDPWLSQLRSLAEASEILGSLSVDRLRHPSANSLQYFPCPKAHCGMEVERSNVTTSGDVRIVVTVSDAGVFERDRHLAVHINVSNAGATGLPICPHGRLWILWEAGGFARGRFRDLGEAIRVDGATNVADHCLSPRQWATFVVDVTSGDAEALRPGPQHIVGLLEVVRPLRTLDPQLRESLRAAGSRGSRGAGNPIQAVVAQAGGPESCEHFSAKVGRVKLPSL